jgi:peptidoglycan/xylan/chitin deacetylase (PgdA/CDA1 family)
MKEFYLRLLYRLQLHRLLRFFSRRRVVLLMYHGFIDEREQHGIANYHGKHVHRDAFRAQMQYLKRYHTVMSLRDFISSVNERKPLPKNPAVVTFDDGYASNYTVAYPVLKDVNVPAAVFISTEFLQESAYFWTDRVEHVFNQAQAGVYEFTSHGRTMTLDLRTHTSRIHAHQTINRWLKTLAHREVREVVDQVELLVVGASTAGKPLPDMYRPLQWSEARAMMADGLVEIGSHTHTHAILTRCTADEAERELSLSKQLLTQNLGKPVDLFAYPNGGPGDFSAQTKELLKRGGYVCGLTTIPGFNTAQDDVYELRRIGIPGNGDFATFVMTLYGVVDRISTAKRTVGKILRLRK